MAGATPRGYPYPSEPDQATGDLNIQALAEAVDTDVAGAVRKSGDTMAGALTLNGDPTSPNHAATMQYVDTTVDTAVAGYLPLTGGDLSGRLGVSGTFSAAVTSDTTASITVTGPTIAYLRMTVTGWGNQFQSRGGSGFWFINDGGTLMPLHASSYATSLASTTSLPPALVDGDGHTDLAELVAVMYEALMSMEGGAAALSAALAARADASSESSGSDR